MSWSRPLSKPRNDHEECLAFAVQCLTVAENTIRWEDEAYLPERFKEPRGTRTPQQVFDAQLSYWHRFNLLPPQ